MAGQMLYAKRGVDKMAKANVEFTKDNEYYTPKSVVDYFGKFDYDPATVEEKAKEFGIKNYDTIETDGLSKDWIKYNKIWINPPFTEKHNFLEKAYETYQIAKNDIYILFPIEFLTTKRFTNASKNMGGKLFIPNGRINFQSGLGKKGKSPAFGSIVMKIQEKWEVEFIDINDLKEK
jgi:phage N-6-adenine-methyltransferase